MKYLVLSLGLFLSGISSASAQVIEFVEPTRVTDVIQVSSPTEEITYYGELNKFPHTYQLISGEPFLLSVTLKEPALASSLMNHNLIIIRERLSSRGVEEVMRVPANSIEWQESYEWWSGDSYLVGATYEAEVPAGVYRVEVSTPENTGKYVLSLGSQPHSESPGYGTRVQNIIAIKRFFDKPLLAAIQSPWLFLPLIFLGSVAGWWYWRRKNRSYA